MEVVFYLILVLVYFVLGVLAALILISLLYPSLRTLPMTVAFVWAGVLKSRAIIHLIWASVFPLILLTIGYFLINLLTPAYEVIKSRSFLVGVLGTLLITLFSGGFRKSNLGADYADFMKRYSRIPEGVSELHVLIATNVVQCSMANYEDPKKDEKWDRMYQSMRMLEYTDTDEESLIKALNFIKATDDEISLANSVFSDQKEYAESMRELENERIENERERQEWEEQQRLESEEFDRQLKEYEEAHHDELNDE